MKKITGSLPFRLLLGVILGIIVGQLAGSGLMHVVVTIKYILNQAQNIRYFLKGACIKPTAALRVRGCGPCLERKDGTDAIT